MYKVERIQTSPGHIGGGIGISSDHRGVLSGIVGADDSLDLVMLLEAPLLKAPLLKPDTPRRAPPVLGHVGSRGLSICIDGGRRPTTLLTNLCRPRSIFTWII
jgi:hypothetical protein